ncbi:MAG: tRNA (guanosine(46)-N7)-methyltransferase TrmB [Bacteroidales bacterium]|nr:tRNA (guanosine(46)-N7)-methyltransferase TrmB [Bacteroidales bacterium]
MGKDKLRKFKENETFKCLIQPTTDQVLNCDHPLKGRWGSDVFGNDKPIVLELGCGKGDYTIDLAERNPSFNYIGIDIKGARLWKGAKYAEEHSLSNVAFLRTRIEFITSLFAEGEVAEIWITFADPQIGREKKRLTSPIFMNRYRSFLKPGGIIHLKTDSRYLHEYSKAMAEQNSLKILASAVDIYGSDRERLYESGLSSLCGSDAVDALFEVQTFYESQYLAQGFPITYLSFLADHEGEFVSPQWDEDTWKDEGHHFVIPSGLPVSSKFYKIGD